MSKSEYAVKGRDKRMEVMMKPRTRFARRSAGPVSAGRATLCAVAVVACGACGTDAGSAGTVVTVDTIGGIETVTNRLDHRPLLGWEVGEPRLVLGRMEGDAADVFGSIGGIVVDSAGRVFVGDARAMEIRVFSRDGEPRFTFGRAGEGPGEFESIDAMRITPAGELLVRDVRQARVSVFGLDGEFRRQIRLERPFLQFQNRPTLWADAAGRIYDWVYFGGGEVDTLGVAVHADSGPLTARVVTATLRREMIRLQRDGSPFAAMPVPWTPFASGAVDRAGRIVSGVGDAYELEVRRPDGELIRRVRREMEPVPRPEWLVDSVEARLDEFTERIGGGQPEDYELPAYLPAFSRIMTDDLDHVWVGRDGDQSRLPTRFDIFDSTGRYLGQLELPPLRLMHLGRDFVAGISYDELGVERAVILPLHRGRT